MSPKTPLLISNPENPEFRWNPYPYYRAFQDEDPVYYRESSNDWVITGYEEAKQHLSRPSEGVDEIPECKENLRWKECKKTGASFFDLQAQASAYFYNHEINRINTPYYTYLKKILTEFFNKKYMVQMHEFIFEETHDLIDTLQNKGHMDVVADYAYPLLAAVTCKILGIPKSDISHFIAWVDNFHASMDIPVTSISHGKGMMAFLGMADYFDALLSYRTNVLNEGLLTHFMRSIDAGG